MSNTSQAKYGYLGPAQKSYRLDLTCPSLTPFVQQNINITSGPILEGQVTGPVPTGPEISTFYNLSGYIFSDIVPNFYKFLYGLGAHLGFYLFDCKDKYKYVGLFDYEDPKKAILHTKLLIDNIISTYEVLVSSNPEEAKKLKYEYLKDDISIDIIVSPSYEKEDILEKIKKIESKRYTYSISLYNRSDIKNKVGAQYEAIGQIKSIKQSKNDKNQIQRSGQN